MNATFVLDRSHPAKSPQFLPKPFSPFSPESLVRCSGCAPPGRTKLKQPTAGRASFFHTVPCVSSPLWRLSVEEKHVPLYPQTAQASSAKTKPSTDPLSWSLFHLDWRLGLMAKAHIIRFSLSSSLSFNEEVCDVCVVVSSGRPLASNTRDLSLGLLP